MNARSILVGGLTVALMVYCAGGTITQAGDLAGLDHEVFAASPPPGVVARAHGLGVIRHRYVTLDPQQTMKDELLNLNLFSDRSLIAERVKREAIGKDGLAWTGRLRDLDGNVFLVAVGDLLAGDIRTGSEVFQIRYAGQGVHAIYQFDASRFPAADCPPDGPRDPLRRRQETSPSKALADTQEADSDPCDLIDALIVYTPAAKNAAGGRPSLITEIYLAIQQVNWSFSIAGVNARVQPVGIHEVNYVESGDMATDVAALQNPTDGIMDNVHALRDRYCADFVSLIVHYPANYPYCGISYAINDRVSPDPAFESDAFNVVRDDCSTTNLSFAHELGHLMGGRHDWFVDATKPPASIFTDNHGYVNLAARWRTVMAYDTHCWNSGTTCIRRPVFSFLPFAGVPAGSSTACTELNLGNPPCDADNARVFNSKRCEAARFRDRTTCSNRNDVWMKDTWEDIGTEPYVPSGVGDTVWRSPYIWNRPVRDPERVFQHIHENPVLGQESYIYVKLHNDSPEVATGRLKLYWSPAATTSNWPNDYNLFSDREISIPAENTRIAVAPFTPSVVGHMCFLARWVSPSDPMYDEQPGWVSRNITYNNNIIWKNVAVAKIQSGSPYVLHPVLISNIDDHPVSVDLVVRLSKTENNLIRSGGEVVLDLRDLYQPWRNAGGLGTGIEDLGPTRVRILDTQEATSEIQGIPLAHLQRTPVNFAITAPHVRAEGPTPPADDDDSVDIRYCSEGGQQIPDNSPGGVTDTLAVADCVEIADLDLSVETSHTWVGDLSYSLRYVDSNRMVTPIDRPGVPASAYGCSGDDIDVVLDDDAARPVEDECAATVPTIQGTLVPGDPPNAEMFETFRGERACGSWELKVVDHAAGDVGRLGPWCLVLGQDGSIPAQPVTHYALDLAQRQVEYDGEVGGMSYDVHVFAENVPGAVPDQASRPGIPLTVQKLGNGDIRLSWGPSCMPLDTDYVVYEGDCGSFVSHQAVRCSTNGLTVATITPSPGNAYYLVAPRNAEFEGSLGLTSDGYERHQGESSCLPQLFGGCP